MLPVIALVGRPNVGKSTLFNRLTRTRAALVADYPGLTRDRQYGIGQVGPAGYVLIDTGGLGSGNGDNVTLLMERQVRQAIAEADHLLFLVDARDGVGPADLDLAAELRRTGTPLTLVVNKTDHLDRDLAAAEFHALGLGAPVPIAAAQGRGVTALMEQVFARLPTAGDAASPDPDAAADQRGTLVAVVGRPNAGKSTLVNRLLGEERVVVYDQPGTTRDSLFIPFQRGEQPYTLIDTAGVRRRARVSDPIEKFSIVKTLQAIAACNVAILVVDARQGIGEQDATLAGHLIEAGRALVIAVNKWDGLGAEARDQIKTALERRLSFLDFASTHFISALHGSGVGLLLEAADQAFANAVRDLATPQLTRLLAEAVTAHPPPLVHGRRIKLRYAHQGGRNPPVIVIHGNQTAALPDTYHRYLNNRFRQALGLDGTPLRLEFKSTDNPYKDRRNPLTPRQLRHRERLRRLSRRQR
ncbi:MAG: ribosome biogenesis GTPase Der [Chromatiaceae bacterium]|nr:MAG: ribosome biogenesis GTPase Der [Chromatiaceae bacterium]